MNLLIVVCLLCVVKIPGLMRRYVTQSKPNALGTVLRVVLIPADHPRTVPRDERRSWRSHDPRSHTARYATANRLAGQTLRSIDAT
jgi:hypothetical protein